jgi:ATP-dependent Clp protease ATP-binding subunit ClpA
MPNQSIFSKYAMTLCATKDDADYPLKDHPQIPYLIDSLARNEQHHLLLNSHLSEKIHVALIESIALYLTTRIVPAKLQNATLIYFDVNRFRLGHETLKEISHDFKALCDETKNTETLTILVINDASILHAENAQSRTLALGQLLQTQLIDEKWRVIAFNPAHSPKISHLENIFSTARLDEPKYNEVLAILKSHQNTIENFHHVLIPNEVFSYALSLSAHYLGGKSQLDKALDLLDSSAARASTMTSQQPVSDNDIPILTTSLLAHVASNWSHIPLSHLHHNKFKLTTFLQHMQQKIFGQDTAINAIGSLLQTTCINLNEKTGPICNLLLVGPAGVGKKEFVSALTEYLFANPEALLHITPSRQPISCLSEVFVTIRSDKTQHMSLLEAIQLKPYAVVSFENINEASSTMIEVFKDIFMHGYAFDSKGNAYDFRHAIIIINTTLGADRINMLTQRQHEASSHRVLDLMQLVLNENNHTNDAHQHLSLQDIQEQIIPCLSCFPAEILRHLHLVPFVSLDQTTIEKIIQLKMNTVTQSLEADFGVTLSYAPEVIQFLAQETTRQRDNAQPILKLFEQHIYSSIANEIVARIDDKNRPKRLALLLNDSGQLLRCEFIATTHESSLYTI